MTKRVLSSEILGNHVGILGKTGSGKSNLAKVVAEDLLAAGERVVILDPTGTWYGLRLTREGTPSPHKVVIFGGAHGDIPIAAHHGEEIAAALARSSTSAIIDTRQLTVRARTVFATAFAETLLQRNAGVLYVIVDESHLFAPQGKVPDPDAGKMLHAWNNLASLGRGVGLILILISQRPAKLHKDSLTQIETLIALRLIGPQDRAAIREWIKESADEGQGAEIMRSLPSLPTGTGWLWAPALDLLEKRSFPLAATLDTGTASAAPDVELGPIDIEAIRAQLGKVEEERKANDPTELRKEIAALRRDLEQRPTETVVEAVEHVIEVEVVTERVAAILADAAFALTGSATAIEEQASAILNALERAAASRSAQQLAIPASTGRRTAARPEASPDSGVAQRQSARPAMSAREAAGSNPVSGANGGASLGKAERLILGALAGYPNGLLREQLAFLADYHPRSPGFVNPLGALRSGGLVEPGFPARLTDAGRRFAADNGVEPIAAPPLDEWLGRVAATKERGLLHELGPIYPDDIASWRLDSWVAGLGKAERVILTHLLDTHPDTSDRDGLAAAAGYHPRSPGFVNPLGWLRSRGFVDGFGLHPDFARLIGR